MTSKPFLRFVPATGAFAAIRIDPVASLAHLDDPLAQLAAANMECKDYIVYVGKHVLRHRTIAFHKENVDFVVQGLPIPIPDHHIELSTFIPISPTLGSESSPPPLSPSGDFPWSDCYLTPFISATVRTKTIRSNKPILCRLGMFERARCSMALEHGRTRQHSLQRAAEENGATNSNMPVPSSPALSALDVNSESKLDSDMRSMSDRNLVASIRATNQLKEAPNDMLTVTFTHDLPAIDKLNDPRSFFEEVELISCFTRESIAHKARREADEAEADARRLALGHRADAYHKLNGGVWGISDENLRPEHESASAFRSRLASRIRRFFHVST
ncbi:hypothetical protein MIND_01358900 [Mycena indigotica]|uniref:Uncharacterized protein n=1 Tax=Mycena indigotica TaxID=2126181 RepID=A0A8H6S083_9AGAR|nr:uncharacterized protein MIND_01358900 [Mycena indigotica]KAF7289845.1 hypothetical protein MIND_01358900 [Mycena indigotica]